MAVTQRYFAAGDTDPSGGPKQLEDATGRRKTWLSPRANALCAAELCYRPRDIDGLYAPTQGVTREEMLSALRRFSDQIRDTRRAGREAADRAS